MLVGTTAPRRRNWKRARAGFQFAGSLVGYGRAGRGLVVSTVRHISAGTKHAKGPLVVE